MLTFYFYLFVFFVFFILFYFILFYFILFHFIFIKFFAPEKKAGTLKCKPIQLSRRRIITEKKSLSVQ